MSTSSSSGVMTGGGPWAGFPTVQKLAQPLLHFVVGLWIFAGGFVFMEPSPYELMFLVAAPMMIFAGVGLHRGTLKLFLMIAAFTPFGLIAVFQVKYTPQTQAFIYFAVTFFLLLTSFFIANYVADAPHRRMRVVMRGYLAAALIAALIGTLAYIGLLPARDLFIKFDRAKATFEDPNVYGPFLVLPAAYVLQRILLGTNRVLIANVLIFGILFVGVFVSFSRAAWGYLLFTSLITFGLVFLLESTGRQKVRMLIMALSGMALMFITLAGLLSIPSINQLFMARASLEQNYDTGETGRFGRQSYAFDLALKNPLGLGPLEFRNYRIIEEPHDTYVTVLHVYGWGGGLIFYVITIMTLWRSFKGMGINSPNRLLMIPLFATYLPMVLESAIIDTDHWRHHFLLIGLIWGISAGYKTVSPEQIGPDRQLI